MALRVHSTLTPDPQATQPSPWHAVLDPWRKGEGVRIQQLSSPLPPDGPHTPTSPAAPMEPAMPSSNPLMGEAAAVEIEVQDIFRTATEVETPDDSSEDEG